MTAAADALIATDRAGTIVLWNPAAERLLGYRRADAVGLTVAPIVPAAYCLTSPVSTGPSPPVAPTPPRTRSSHRRAATASTIGAEMTISV